MPKRAPSPWFFYFRQSAAWWDRGEHVLLFKRTERTKEGATPIAMRSHPFSEPLPGLLGGARDTDQGWRDHPATKAAELAYGLLESA